MTLFSIAVSEDLPAPSFR